MWVICGLREKFYEGGDGEREKAEGWTFFMAKSWDFLDSVAEGVLQVGVVVGEGMVDVGGLWAEGEVL
ncbi:hypothetical protein DKX38_007942 [Salix brachista]|uniref:Uncharacterized protein n=1 Tax=Salix brachista TaxID=2182728 RepID=A0A5N5MRG7_9ROSI|nr:hypothetical protein DKX38_007942 [Salix brachista]